jgi:hypothetical protein
MSDLAAKKEAFTLADKQHTEAVMAYNAYLQKNYPQGSESKSIDGTSYHEDESANALARKVSFLDDAREEAREALEKAETHAAKAEQKAKQTNQIRTLGPEELVQQLEAKLEKLKSEQNALEMVLGNVADPGKKKLHELQLEEVRDEISALSNPNSRAASPSKGSPQTSAMFRPSNGGIQAQTSPTLARKLANTLGAITHGFWSKSAGEIKADVDPQKEQLIKRNSGPAILGK